MFIFYKFPAKVIIIFKGKTKNEKNLFHFPLIIRIFRIKRMKIPPHRHAVGQYLQVLSAILINPEYPQALPAFLCGSWGL